MPRQDTLSRRSFLQRGALVATGVALPYVIPRHVLADAHTPGANQRIGIGYIGCGRRAAQLTRLPKNCQVVGVADCNMARAESWGKKYRCPAFQDYRKLLESKDLHGVIIASPEHWHALHTIHACQAGKDIYCEKPITLTIREGRAMVEAVRKYDRVFQAGSQQRSDPREQIGCRLLREGAIGKIHTVIGRNYPSPWLCSLPTQPCPQHIDWDMWHGQVEVRPYHQDIYLPRANPGWMSFRRYAGGEMLGWGAHGLDQVQAGLGMDQGGPVEIWIDDSPKYKELVISKPTSRDWGYKNCTSPRVHFRYENGAVLKLDNGPSFGGVFVGEQGKIEISRGRFASKPAEIARQALQGKDLRGGTSEHLANWVECIQTRDRPTADIEIAHRSTTVCHLGNIARWLGRKLQWDAAQETFPGDEQASALLERPQRKRYALPHPV